MKIIRLETAYAAHKYIYVNIDKITHIYDEKEISYISMGNNERFAVKLTPVEILTMLESMEGR